MSAREVDFLQNFFTNALELCAQARYFTFYKLQRQLVQSTMSWMSSLSNVDVAECLNQ